LSCVTWQTLRWCIWRHALCTRISPALTGQRPITYHRLLAALGGPALLKHFRCMHALVHWMEREIGSSNVLPGDIGLLAYRSDLTHQQLNSMSDKPAMKAHDVCERIEETWAYSNKINILIQCSRVEYFCQPVRSGYTL
jgi:hypothetical protein